MKVKLTEKRTIHNYCEPYIIAELGSNHNGDMNLARELIRQAKLAGANCVKFQSWTKDTIFSRKSYDDNYFISDDYRNRSDHTLESIVEAYSVSEQELIEMRQFCENLDIDFASTPFSTREVDFLVDKLHAPFIKVASMDVNNYPFLEYIAKKGKPILLSTGLSELSEIDKAIKVIETAGNKSIIILHCVSVYPPDDSDINLRNILTYQNAYPNYPVGFSDHTLGVTIPLASVVFGVAVIEKHFTLDNNLEGWDHKVSATPAELQIICSETKRIVKSLGSSRVEVPESEERRKSFRRSIVTTRDIRAGEVIRRDDLDFKRPGDGIAPEFLEWVVGRTAKVDLPYDRPISKDQLK